MAITKRARSLQPDPVQDTDLENALADLPKLSIRDQAFANAVLEGHTYTDAFRQALPEPDRWSRKALGVQACRLAAKPDIQAYLDRMRQIGAQQAARSLEAFTSKLERIEALAIDDKQFTAATRAAELNGRANGYLTSQPSQPLGNGPGPNELVASVRLKLGDEAGRRLANRLGLLDLAAPGDETPEPIDVTPER